MSTIKAKNIKQTVIGGTTQPLKIGGILDDGSDAKISIDTNGNTTLNQVTGIKFPATQVPSADANTLDDYEEGTWTPTPTAASGSLSISQQFGTYTKIGNMVYISARLIFSAGTGSGLVKIGGFPFSADRSTVDAQGFYITEWYNGLFSASQTFAACRFDGSNTAVTPMAFSVNGNTDARFQVSGISNTLYMAFVGVYKTS